MFKDRKEMPFSNRKLDHFVRIGLRLEQRRASRPSVLGRLCGLQTRAGRHGAGARRRTRTDPRTGELPESPAHTHRDAPSGLSVGGHRHAADSRVAHRGVHRAARTSIARCQRSRVRRALDPRVRPPDERAGVALTRAALTRLGAGAAVASAVARGGTRLR